MKTLKEPLFALEATLVRIGERLGFSALVYNPITWMRFLVSARRNGKAFAEAVKIFFPRARSVVDFGAGAGGYVQALRSMGLSAEGLEYSKVGRLISWCQGVKIFPWACGSPNTLSRLPLRRCDLAISIEVAEHIVPELSQSLVDQMGSVADTVIFSAAQPGQGGQGHQNERPKEFWEKLFIQQNFRRDSPAADQFVQTMAAHGFRGCALNNLMIFKRAR